MTQQQERLAKGRLAEMEARLRGHDWGPATIFPWYVRDALDLITELRALRQEREWRAVDETYKPRSFHDLVLVVHGENGEWVSEAYYRPEEQEWWLANTGPGDFDHSEALTDVACWQPLPPPPEEG